MTVALVGYGAHGRDIEAAFPLLFTHIVEDDEECHRWKPGEYVLGMNRPEFRRRVAERLDKEGWTPRETIYGPGVIVFPNVHVGPGVHLGRHTHVNFNAGLTRCTLGDFVTVGPGAVICGDVKIGDRVMIGAGAVISNLVNIRSDATVGAGAVVVDDVHDGATVVGVPARPL